MQRKQLSIPPLAKASGILEATLWMFSTSLLFQHYFQYLRCIRDITEGLSHFMAKPAEATDILGTPR